MTQEVLVQFLDDVMRVLEETEQHLRDMDREIRIMRLGRAKLRELGG